MFCASTPIGVKLSRMSKSILKKSGSVRVELTLTVSTWPSGGDFATASRPIAPPAPPRFSTRNGWFHLACILGARMRAIRSGVVAGVWPRMNLTGRFERPWAMACHGRASAPAPNTNCLRLSTLGLGHLNAFGARHKDPPLEKGPLLLVLEQRAVQRRADRLSAPGAHPFRGNVLREQQLYPV